jgi:hypothetical protein
VSDLVKFHIPAGFVLARVLPTPSELVYGFEQGWLSEPDVVAIGLAMYGVGEAPAVIENLALLLSDELSRVPDLVEELKTSRSADGDADARVWLFLALAWVHENEGDFIDPYEVVEMLYADFEYPSAIEGFVRFMPPPAGEPVGMSALDARWEAYLSAEADWFRARGALGQER